MTSAPTKPTITFGLQEFMVLFMQAVVVVISLFLFTRGLATKEDITRLDGRMDTLSAEIRSLNQNHISHLSAHHVVRPKP